jgi:hypothetical protein
MSDQSSGGDTSGAYLPVHEYPSSVQVVHAAGRVEICSSNGPVPFYLSMDPQTALQMANKLIGCAHHALEHERMMALIEKSSLGTPEAKRLRDSVSDEDVAEVMRRLKNGNEEEP